MKDKTTYWKVVNAIRDYIRENHNRRPSVEEIRVIVDLKSTNTVLYHILAAVENGDLVEEGEPRQARRYAAKERE